MGLDRGLFCFGGIVGQHAPKNKQPLSFVTQACLALSLLSNAEGPKVPEILGDFFGRVRSGSARGAVATTPSRHTRKEKTTSSGAPAS